MSIKELREKKARLEAEARAKLESITATTTADEARAIEAKHAELLGEITRLGAEITRAEEDDGETTDGSRKRKRKAKAKDDDESDDSTDAEADEDDDESDGEDEQDDDDEGKKRKRKRKLPKGKDADPDKEDGDEDRAHGSVLSRSAMAEMAVIDNQARGLGIELDLAGAITRNETPNGMRKRLFEKLAERSQGRGPRGSVVDVMSDERDGRAAAMELALINRMLGSRGGSGQMKYEPKGDEQKLFVERNRDRAKVYAGRTLVEIAAECIGHRGNIYDAQKFDILTRAFNSTSDFPSIFLNVLNKSLLARYELHMPTYREIAVERPFNDFRPHPMIRAGDFPALQPVSETGELKYGTSQDNNETISVVPYGVVFAISRTMLVNDDLGAIDQILGSAGDTVLVFENNTFFTMFNSNPVLNQDSTAVFATAHGNLASPGAAPSVTTIGAGRQALRAMKSLSGLYLNVPPRIILTGPAQETAADQMVTAITPTLTTSVNPFSGRLRSVSDANITDDSWYLATEPGRVPCFAYGFLNGANGPRVRTFEPFGTQGVKISLEHDFACGAVDFRGFYKSPAY